MKKTSSTGDLGLANDSVKLRHKTLIFMRWLAIIGQLIAVILAYAVFQVTFAIIPVSGVLLAGALLILFSSFTKEKHWYKENTALMYLSLDLVQLTVLLGLTGGLFNPFVMLMAAPVTVAAALLSRKSALILLVIALLGLLSISLFFLPLNWQDAIYPVDTLRPIGTAIALTVFMSFVTFYLASLVHERRKLARALVVSEKAAEREEHMSDLGALAAAVAHELGSPLGVMAILVKEMQNQMQDSQTTSGNLDAIGESFQSDLATLEDQIEICRQALSFMAQEPRQEHFEKARKIPPAEMITLAVRPFANDTIKIEIKEAQTETKENSGEDKRRQIPQLPIFIRADPLLLHGLGAVLQNALQFAKSRVEVEVERQADLLIYTIKDDGPGFSPLIYSTLGEPFVSTGPSGRNSQEKPRGLGLFIAETLLAKLGGTITYGRTPDGGAEVRLAIPLSSIT